MTEDIKMKKMGNTFRLALFLWIIVANVIVLLAQIPYSYLIFMGNIMMFTMSGDDMVYKFKSVMCGGLVGMVLTYVISLGIAKMTPVLGMMPAFLLGLGLGVFILIYLHPKAPVFLNNVGFLYLTVCAANSEAFMTDFPRFLLIFLLAGGIFNLVCLYILKLVKNHYMKA